MDNDLALNVFADSDHQKALAVINWLNNCHTRHELNQVIKVALLPMLSCNGAFYTHTMGECNSLQLIESVHNSTCCGCRWQSFLKENLQKLAEIRANSSRGMMITDDTIRNDMRTDSLKNPDCSFDQPCSLSHQHGSILTLNEDCEPAYQFHLCNLGYQYQAFNQRGMELLKIIKPTLLHTIRLIQLHEQGYYAPRVMQFCSQQVEPIAVVRSNGEFIFQSHAFKKIIENEKQSLLSHVSALIELIQSKQKEWHSFITKLGKRLYEIKLTLVGRPNSQQNTYLMYVSRITHVVGKIFRQFSSKGLTPRELEITMLIYQGMKTREIAETIHLSYHTVRNHIKSIYSKLGVSSRGEMLVQIG